MKKMMLCRNCGHPIAPSSGLKTGYGHITQSLGAHILRTIYGDCGDPVPEEVE